MANKGTLAASQAVSAFQPTFTVLLLVVALALFQPEIPANTGTLMRLSACFGVTLHLIGPTAFTLDDRSLRRAGLDYRDKALTQVHVDFEAFMQSLAWNMPRLLLMTTQGTRSYMDFTYREDDVIVMGQESAGAPKWLHGRADERLTIPMQPGMRSLNMALSAGMAVSEALRQTDGFPVPAPV